MNKNFILLLGVFALVVFSGFVSDPEITVERISGVDYVVAEEGIEIIPRRADSKDLNKEWNYVKSK